MRLSREVSVIDLSSLQKLSEVESNHRRRRIRSLCFRYNTGQMWKQSSTADGRLPSAVR